MSHATNIHSDSNLTERKVRIAQISCGTEWSGIQHELDKSAEVVGAELFFPEASLDEIDLGVERLSFSPASHNLRVMLGQVIALNYYRDVDGILLLTCFGCAEGSLARTIVRRHIQRASSVPIITYSFTERTKALNLLLRMEALVNLIRRRKLLRITKHSGTTLGIDSGSSWTKCVLMQDGHVIGSSALPTADILETGVKAAQKAIRMGGSKFAIDSDPVGVTGYGRHLLHQEFDTRVAMEEITVCAKGAAYLNGQENRDATIIDIGGNDNKATTIHNGVPDSFTVGGVCAGASGRFLEVAAARIGTSISEFGTLALKGDSDKVRMNAYCIVFGIQDIVSALASGARREDVAAAACSSVAEQFFEQQLQEIEIKPPVIEVGTTSLNEGLVKAIEHVSGNQIVVPPYSQYAGAVGAALLASDDTLGE